MINLEHGYHIDADTYGYMLYREGAPDKKGNPTKANTTYHPTIGDALYRYMQSLQRDGIRDHDMTLHEALDFFAELEQHVQDIKARLDKHRNGVTKG